MPGGVAFASGVVPGDAVAGDAAHPAAVDAGVGPGGNVREADVAGVPGGVAVAVVGVALVAVVGEAVPRAVPLGAAEAVAATDAVGAEAPPVGAGEADDPHAATTIAAATRKAIARLRAGDVGRAVMGETSS
jgi:hypothetical protein